MSELPEALEQEQPPKLYRFVLFVFVWLIPCFVVWVSLSSPIAAPGVLIADWVLSTMLPSYVHEFTLAGTQALLTTQYGELDGAIVAAETAGYRLAYPLNTQILSFSLPFYAALHFATPGQNSLARFGQGMLVLYPLFIVGLVSVSLKNIMLGLGSDFIHNSTGLESSIAMMYQISTLMVPPLAPVLVWAWQSRTSSLLQQLIVKP
jgi:hypothetical protein